MLKHCSFGEESHATSLLSQVWSKNTYLFPHPGDFRASAHLFRGQTLLLQGYGNIRNATWCQWLPSCWRQRHGHTSTKELSLLGLSHTRSPTRLNLCYTEEATEATHRLERQYNACANRKKQCRPNETKPNSNSTCVLLARWCYRLVLPNSTCNDAIAAVNMFILCHTSTHKETKLCSKKVSAYT